MKYSNLDSLESLMSFSNSIYGQKLSYIPYKLYQYRLRQMVTRGLNKDTMISRVSETTCLKDYSAEARIICDLEYTI